MPPPDDGWFDPQVRLPRRGQPVFVRTREGSDHPAVFDVQFTHDWPEGVSWLLDNGIVALRFEDVRLWSDRERRADAAAAAKTTDLAAETGDTEGATYDGLALIRELHDELALTAGILSHLQDAALEWSPHPSIPSVRVLACRIVRIVARIRWIIELESVERSFEPDLPDLRTTQEILATYSADATELDVLIDSITPELLGQPWTLERDGEVVTRQPRADALRAYGLGPLLTHRAEIALLLTAMNVPVPHPYATWAFEDDAGTG